MGYVFADGVTFVSSDGIDSPERDGSSPEQAFKTFEYATSRLPLSRQHVSIVLHGDDEEGYLARAAEHLRRPVLGHDTSPTVPYSPREILEAGSRVLICNYSPPRIDEPTMQAHSQAILTLKDTEVDYLTRNLELLSKKCCPPLDLKKTQRRNSQAPFARGGRGPRK